MRCAEGVAWVGAAAKLLVTHMFRACPDAPRLRARHVVGYLRATATVTELAVDTTFVHRCNQHHLCKACRNACFSLDRLVLIHPHPVRHSPASTVGAVVATHLETGRIAEGVQRSHIHFRPIPAEVREKLVEEGEVFYCAGGLMVEHPLVEPHIVRMEGTQCSVMGLPKQLTLELMLQAAGL